jgi:hypothetical protein
MIKNLIPIVYPGGAYGTYLEWVLTTLASNAEIVPPFTSNGSSHLFNGNQIIGSISPNWWYEFATQSTDQHFVRLHPKSSKEESISNRLLSMLEIVDKIVYLYPDKKSKMLVINNSFTKILADWFAYQLLDTEFSNNLYSNWPIEKDTPSSQIPIWIKREILSFYMVPAWEDQVEWYYPDTWCHDRCQTILIGDLLYNFEHTISSIQQFCNLKFKRSIKELVPYHNQMLELQMFLNQDALCDAIINSIVNQQEFDWSDQPLPLVSQAWVQWQLRNLNYEIKCHELDTFPTNSVQLKELLYTT